MDALLTVRSVGKSFGRLRAVDGVDLTVREGEIFGIAGPNGAGKSTLFNVLTRIPYGPDQGTVSFGGHRIDKLQPHEISRAGLARTFQKETSFGSLTVRTNVELAARYGGRLRPVAGQALAAGLLEEFGLAARADDRADSLPLFQKKRLMLASSLAMAPSMLLLDEPASGLNQVEVRELDSLIVDLNRRGVTIVLIEHVLPLLMAVSHRVLVMDRGRVLAEGSAADIARDERVIEAYLGERGRKVAHADG